MPGRMGQSRYKFTNCYTCNKLVQLSGKHRDCPECRRLKAKGKGVSTLEPIAVKRSGTAGWGVACNGPKADAISEGFYQGGGGPEV